MFVRLGVVGLLAGLLIGCGSSGGGDDVDASPNAPDAAVPCTNPLELGHCIDTATNEPCLDFDAPGRQFMPLTGTEVVQPIVGPQGSDMFVFAVRAAGVDPGTEVEPPLVELAVYLGTEERGGYLSWPLFFPDADKQAAPQLFTVVYDAPGMEGQTVRLTGEVIDPSDNRFCGETTFVVGTLIPGNTDPH